MDWYRYIIITLFAHHFYVGCLKIDNRLDSSNTYGRTKQEYETWGQKGAYAPPEALKNKARIPLADVVRQSSTVAVTNSLSISLKLKPYEKRAIHLYTIGRKKFPTDAARTKILKSEFGDVPGYCEAMQSALAKIPASPGVVFRGTYGLDVQEIFRLYDSMTRKQPIKLGVSQFDTWTSFSRNPNVAYFFLAQSATHIERQYSIFYTVEQQSGRSVEKISEFPEQAEVILNPAAHYFVQDMIPIEGYSDTVLVKLREDFTKRGWMGFCSCMGN